MEYTAAQIKDGTGFDPDTRFIRHTIAADGKIRTHDQVLRLITAPRSDQYPYALKPAGWTRETDPFQAEALARLGAAGDTFEDVSMFEEVTA